MQLPLSLALAAASALALNWGFFAQHSEAAALPPLAPLHPLRSLTSLFGARRWLAGFLAGIGGWALYVAALAFGPLSIVQAASAGGIGILALLVWRLSGVTLARHEWLGVALAVLGLTLLGLSLLGRGGNRHHWSAHGSWIAIALWIAVSALLAALAAGPLARRLAAGAGLGVGAGFLYAAGDVATKAAVSGGARTAFVPVLLACHGLAFVLLQLSFQRGAALATAGVATLFTNAVPIAAGMALFHEPLPGGALGALRVLAFVAVVAGAALLTRTSDSGEPRPAGRDARAARPGKASAAEPISTDTRSRARREDRVPVGGRARRDARDRDVRLTRRNRTRTPHTASPASVGHMRNPNRCPGCGEYVSLFAAGCSICGAALDPNRGRRRSLGQRLRSRWLSGRRLGARVPIRARHD